MARARKSKLSVRSLFEDESLSELTSAANRLEKELSMRSKSYPGFDKLKTPMKLTEFSKTVSKTASQAEVMKRYLDFWLSRIVSVQNKEFERYEKRRARSRILPKLSVEALNETRLKKLQVEVSNTTTVGGIQMKQAESLSQFVNAIAIRSQQTVQKVASYLSPDRIRTRLTDEEMELIFKSSNHLMSSQFKGGRNVSSLAILSYGNLIRAFRKLGYSDLYNLAAEGLITVSDAPYMWDAGGKGNSLGYLYGTNVGAEPPELTLFSEFLSDASVSQTRMKRMRASLKKSDPNSPLIQELNDRIG